MCTVTLVPAGPPDHPDHPGRGWRLACNRDESRKRPAAEPPSSHTFGPRHALMPTDPPSGGTWIAVNSAALAATLLNVNLPDRPIALRPVSRGRSPLRFEVSLQGIPIVVVPALFEMIAVLGRKARVIED